MLMQGLVSGRKRKQTPSGGCGTRVAEAAILQPRATGNYQEPTEAGRVLP